MKAGKTAVDSGEDSGETQPALVLVTWQSSQVFFVYKLTPLLEVVLHYQNHRASK